jgi:hypothetical protein
MPLIMMPKKTSKIKVRKDYFFSNSKLLKFKYSEKATIFLFLLNVEKKIVSFSGLAIFER